MQRKQPFLCTCVSGANRRLVVVLETGRFLKDQLLQPLFGKVVQFHGESEGLLCYRLHVSHTRTHRQPQNVTSHFVKTLLYICKVRSAVWWWLA